MKATLGALRPSIAIAEKAPIIGGLPFYDVNFQGLAASIRTVLRNDGLDTIPLSNMRAPQLRSVWNGHHQSR